MSKKFEPNLKEFTDILLESRGKGKTWRKIAAEQGVSRDTLYTWFNRNPGVKDKIDAEAKDEIKENLRCTAIELALKEKNPTMLIYLNKAINQLYDQPKPDGSDDAPAEKEEMFPAMTKEQWNQLHKERQKKKCVP